MNGRITKASFSGDLRRHTNGAPALRGLGLFCILQDNCGLRFDQFRIAADMLVTLFLRQIAAVKVLGDLPKLGLERVVIRLVEKSPAEPKPGGAGQERGSSIGVR